MYEICSRGLQSPHFVGNISEGVFRSAPRETPTSDRLKASQATFGAGPFFPGASIALFCPLIVPHASLFHRKPQTPTTHPRKAAPPRPPGGCCSPPAPAGACSRGPPSIARQDLSGAFLKGKFMIFIFNVCSI